jgi:hypothetical protein
MAGVGEDRDKGRFRRLPPHVRPTGTEHDVTPPAPAPEATYANPLIPEGGIAGYAAIAEYLTSTPRNSPRRVMLRVIYRVSALAALLWIAYRIVRALL